MVRLGTSKHLCDGGVFGWFGHVFGLKKLFLVIFAVVFCDLNSLDALLFW